MKDYRNLLSWEILNTLQNSSISHFFDQFLQKENYKTIILGKKYFKFNEALYWFKTLFRLVENFLNVLA